MFLFQLDLHYRGNEMNYVLDVASLQQHHNNNFPAGKVFSLRHEFARNRFLKLRDIVDEHAQAAKSLT